jgi:glycosyltransferase involved in cell wall biosynthesis
MPGLYRCADALLHMSRDEPSAIAYVEALATGLPIVAHDWEVTRWTLPDHDLLVDTSSESAVTAALTRAIADKSPERIQNRREIAQRRFSWSQIGHQYSNLLLELCAAPSTAPHLSPSPDTPGEGWGEGHSSSPQPNRAPHLSPSPGTPGEGWGEGPSSLPDVGVVTIGRNEGDRLIRCLQSVHGKAAAVVYVDSASDDNSVTRAKQLGADVVQLDKSTPFTAALARNLGAQRLKEIAPNLKYIQFVDGDCEVRPDWMPRARRELESNESLGAVCGRRRERFPRRSIYNRLIDIEWNTPPGPALAVGGDAMFRLKAFDAVGGYDPTVMAGEEPQLCLRIRHSHYTILRIEAEMTLHDADITRFSQWWRRHVRAGYGTLDVNRRFQVDGERLFGKMVRSAPIWALAWPAAIILAALIAGIARGPAAAIIAAAVVFAALPLQVIRLTARALLHGMPPRLALAFASMTMLSKWAWFRGQIKYYLDRSRGRGLELIEYKRPSSDPAHVIPV